MHSITFDRGRGRFAPVVLAALLACALVVTALTATASAQTKKLRIAYTTSPTNVAIVVAKEQGFYQRNGLDVTLTPQTQSNTTLLSLGKQYDISNGTATQLIGLAAKNFAPMLMTGQDYNVRGVRSSTQVVVEKGINSWKQLKGKRIGIVATGTGIQYVAMAAVLKRNGIDPKKDVKFVTTPFPSMVDALRAGTIDAAVAVEPYATQLKLAGLGPLGDPLASVTKTSPSTIWIAKASEVKKDKAKYRAFYKAYSQTLDWMKTHETEWKESVSKNFGVPQAVANRLVLFPYMRASIPYKWIDAWIKPAEQAGVIKKGKIKTMKPYVFKP